ncbi:MAG: glycosyltransferase family 4 protein [Thiohalocapsa sp.]
MKVWLPYVKTGSGLDVSTEFLSKGLNDKGHEAVLQSFPHALQYFPWRFRKVKPPQGTDLIISSTWNGFAFHRPDKVNITVERLFVLDPAYRAYRTPGQAVFHELLVRHFVKRSVRTADACAAVSRHTARALAARLAVSEPRTILNAVDTSFFSPAPWDERLSDFGGRPFRLVFVGNFTRRKGADIMPRIMRELGSGFELSFTSGLRGGERGRHPNNMHCLGRLSLEDVRAAYRNADALLFPSRIEGMPRAVMEAMACATPVIAANTSSLPEAVNNGRNGWLCPPDDVAAFAGAIRKLALDKPGWQRMAEEARATAVRRFSLERMVDEYLALAAELQDRRRGLIVAA